MIVGVHPAHHPIESGLEAGHSTKPGRHGGIGRIDARLGHACRALEDKISLRNVELALPMPLPTERTPDPGGLPPNSFWRNEVVGGGFLAKPGRQYLAQRQLPAMG